MTDKARKPERPRVTILTPVYNEQESLPRYEQAVAEVLVSRSEYDFRILFIEDGSSDGSWEIIEEICARNPRFEGIRLSRNYGSHVALRAGFANAEGDAVAILSCDLQDPPEVILEFLKKWQDGAKIVWGHRRTRKDRTWRILASDAFRKLLRRFAMPRGSKFTTGSFLLVDREVAECFNKFQETNRSTFALMAWTGFDQAVVEYDRRERVAGVSGWNFSKMLRSMYDTFIGFSLLPVRCMTLLGVCVFFFAMGLSVYLLIVRIAGHPVSGWTSIMLALSFFFGVQFLLAGLAGEYLYRIYAEVVRRPPYFISDKTNGPNEQSGRVA